MPASTLIVDIQNLELRENKFVFSKPFNPWCFVLVTLEKLLSLLFVLKWTFTLFRLVLNSLRSQQRPCVLGFLPQ